MKNAKTNYTPEERWENCYNAVSYITNTILERANSKVAEASNKIMTKHLSEVRDIMDSDAPVNEINRALDELEEYILQCYGASKII